MSVLTSRHRVTEPRWNGRPTARRLLQVNRAGLECSLDRSIGPAERSVPLQHPPTPAHGSATPGPRTSGPVSEQVSPVSSRRKKKGVSTFRRVWNIPRVWNIEPRGGNERQTYFHRYHPCRLLDWRSVAGAAYVASRARAK